MGLVGSSSHTPNTPYSSTVPDSFSYTYTSSLSHSVVLNTHHRHAIQVSTHTNPRTTGNSWEKTPCLRACKHLKPPTKNPQKNHHCHITKPNISKTPTQSHHIKNRSPHRSITSIKQVLVKYQVTSNFHQA